jgi:lipopolysaccharide transport system permease protein
MHTVSALRSLWAFRSFVIGSVRRDYQLRYRSTLLGFAWTLLQPLSMILIYTLVFSHLMGARAGASASPFAYSIHLCTGIFAWGLFAEIIQRCQSVFLDNANLLKKLRFPRLTLPAIVTATALLNFSIVCLLFAAFLLFTGNLPGLGALVLVPLLGLQVLFELGLGMTLAVLNVFFRDIGPLTGLALQLWFWATPIVYPVSILPPGMLPWMKLNPMFHLIQSYQNVLAGNAVPDWQAIALVAALSLAIGLYAVGLFQRHAADMVDEL